MCQPESFKDIRDFNDLKEKPPCRPYSGRHYACRETLKHRHVSTSLPDLKDPKDFNDPNPPARETLSRT